MAINRRPPGAPDGGRFAEQVHPEAPTNLAGETPGGSNEPGDAVELSFIGGGSDKFYRVETDGSDVTITYGRNGSSGKATTTCFGTEDEAESFAAKKIKAKLTKGYRPTETGDVLAGAVNDRFKVDESVLPMLAKSITPEQAEVLIGDPDWVAQLKLDGDRAVVAVKAGQVAAFNRQGQPKKQNVAARNLDAFRGLEGDWVIDGEVVDGTYHVFDLISAPGMDQNAGFEERFGRLQTMLDDVRPDPVAVTAVPVATGAEAKRSLLSSAKTNHDEGLIFRRRHAGYDHGRRSPGLVKHKFVKEADCVVTGMSTDKQSVELSVRDNSGKMIRVGSASTIGKGNLTVGSVVEARFLYVHDTSAPTMVQPRIARLRHDKSADECLLDQFANAGTNKAGSRDETGPEPD